MTLRNVPCSELGAAFLGFKGDVLLHRQLRFLFPKNQNIRPESAIAYEPQEGIDEGIDLSRDR